MVLFLVFVSFFSCCFSKKIPLALDISKLWRFFLIVFLKRRATPHVSNHVLCRTLGIFGVVQDANLTLWLWTLVELLEGFERETLTKATYSEKTMDGSRVGKLWQCRKQNMDEQMNNVKSPATYIRCKNPPALEHTLHPESDVAKCTWRSLYRQPYMKKNAPDWRGTMKPPFWAWSWWFGCY